MWHVAYGIWHVACHSHVVRISKKLNKYNNLKRKYAKSIAMTDQPFTISPNGSTRAMWLRSVRYDAAFVLHIFAAIHMCWSYK